MCGTAAWLAWEVVESTFQSLEPATLMQMHAIKGLCQEYHGRFHPPKSAILLPKLLQESKHCSILVQIPQKIHERGVLILIIKIDLCYVGSSMYDVGVRIFHPLITSYALPTIILVNKGWSADQISALVRADY